jgi:hypothetical protein
MAAQESRTVKQLEAARENEKWKGKGKGKGSPTAGAITSSSCIWLPWPGSLQP